MEEVQNLLELGKIWSAFDTALYSKSCLYFNTEGTAKILSCISSISSEKIPKLDYTFELSAKEENQKCLHFDTL